MKVTNGILMWKILKAFKFDHLNTKMAGVKNIIRHRDRKDPF